MTYEFGKIDLCELLLVQEASIYTQDMIQVISFDAVPDAGTWQIRYDRGLTSALAYDADEDDVKAALLTLSGVNDVDVYGDYNDGFEIMFQGVDGNTTKQKFSTNQTGLESGGDTVTISVEITGRGFDNLGNYNLGAVNETEILANIQPLSGDDIDQLAEYDQSRRHLNLWTKTEVSKNQWVLYEDEEFEIENVELWRGYYKALLIEIKAET